MADGVSLRIEEPAKTPWPGLLFGWGAMLPFIPGAVAAWLLRDPAPAVGLTIDWGGAVLVFLAGVRRGLSFRTPGGEDVAQIVTMLGLFLLALGALVSVWTPVSVVLLIIGYAAVAVLDPIAARRREVPPYFARLRPVQMVVPLGCLGAILWRLLE